jgi:hypothetical protein
MLGESVFLCFRTSWTLGSPFLWDCSWLSFFLLIELGAGLSAIVSSPRAGYLSVNRHSGKINWSILSTRKRQHSVRSRMNLD